MKSLFFSVVIPTYNRKPILEKCLRAMEQQTIPADSAIADRLWGKTGTVSGNISLAGYLEPPNYDPLAFSILINQSDLPSGELRQAIDQIVLQLARLQVCNAQVEPTR